MSVQETDSAEQPETNLFDKILPTFQENNSIDEIKSFVLNFSDGCSYDNAFQRYISRHQIVKTTKTEKIYNLCDKLIDDNEQLDNDVNELIQCINKYGYENTTINFECCSNYVYGKSNIFINEKISSYVIKFIVHMLSKGSQVICADFALKALINCWDEQIFGVKCPFVNIDTITGELIVKYNVDFCKETVFPQLKTIAELSEYDDKNNASINIFAMSGTICYTISDDIDNNISLDILSVATHKKKSKRLLPMPVLSKTICGKQPATVPNAGGDMLVNEHEHNQDDEIQNIEEFSQEYKKYFVQASGSNVHGLPIHSVVQFKHLRGSLVVSSVHLINLFDIDTSLEKLLIYAKSILEPARSGALEREFSNMTQKTVSQLRRYTSIIASEISTSTPYKYKKTTN